MKRNPPLRLGGERAVALLSVLVAVAVSILLAAIVAPALIQWIEDSKLAKAQSDAGAIAAGMNRFFLDTRRWPGQAEILKAGSAVRFLITGDPSKASFPDLTGFTGLEAVTCTSGLLGVSANVTAFDAATPSGANSLDLADFLIKKPPAEDYPNWRGPYLGADIRSDPWDRAWVVNVIPLFCGETLAEAASGGAAGYGWVLSGGPNRTLQTNFKDARLNPQADDAGVIVGKLLTQSP